MTDAAEVKTESALLELAEWLETKAVNKLHAYAERGDRRNSYDGSDFLNDAEQLFSCAAALKVRASLPPSTETRGEK